jgi:hypothetical protein
VLAPQGDDVNEQLQQFGREVLPLLSSVSNSHLRHS